MSAKTNQEVLCIYPRIVDIENFDCYYTDLKEIFAEKIFHADTLRELFRLGRFINLNPDNSITQHPVFKNLPLVRFDSLRINNTNQLDDFKRGSAKNLWEYKDCSILFKMQSSIQQNSLLAYCTYKDNFVLVDTLGSWKICTPDLMNQVANWNCYVIPFNPKYPQIIFRNVVDNQVLMLLFLALQRNFTLIPKVANKVDDLSVRESGQYNIPRNVVSLITAEVIKHVNIKYKANIDYNDILNSMINSESQFISIPRDFIKFSSNNNNIKVNEEVTLKSLKSMSIGKSPNSEPTDTIKSDEFPPILPDNDDREQKMVLWIWEFLTTPKFDSEIRKMLVGHGIEIFNKQLDKFMKTYSMFKKTPGGQWTRCT
jgi:hypothetical protein